MTASGKLIARSQPCVPIYTSRQLSQNCLRGEAEMSLESKAHINVMSLILTVSD